MAEPIESNASAEMLERLQKFWNETMQITEARWVVWLTLLLVLVVTAVYLVKLFRDFAFGLRPSEADRISDMRNLKEIGALSEAEYRRAREALALGATPSKGRSERSSVGERVSFREVAGEDSPGSEP